MAHNGLRAGDVSWLLRTVKIPQYVAFCCGNQAENRKDTSISFHVFPKDNRSCRAWIQAVERTSSPKSPRLCLEYFDAYCFEYTVRHSIGLLKLILVSFLFFTWLLQPKATHCCILTVRSNHDTSSARSALCAIQDGDRRNFKRAIGPIFGSR